MLRKNVYIRYLTDMIFWLEMLHKGIVVLMIDKHFGHFYSFMNFNFVCMLICIIAFICTNIVSTYINTQH